ncbi:MAG: phytanoyl-CoA dioxygenase family protein [Candidatus Puniceispirillaceae bacterium]
MAQQATRFDWQGTATAQMVRSYEQQGYLVLDGFATISECDQLLQQTKALVSDFDADAHKVVFSADGQSHAATDYFMNSASNISFFLEKGAVDDTGMLIKDKMVAVNKIGHALHDLDPVFESFSHQQKFADLAYAIGFQKPQLLQSMVICKQPHIGGEVSAHQDSTFLFTEPQSCVGFWLALEDATIENGCMWGAPAGHLSGLKSRFVRRDGAMVMEPYEEGDMPDCEVALTAPKGTLILLHGRFPHLSPANLSGASRYAYALHMIDGTADYAAENWLQRKADMPLRGFES